MPDEGKPNGRVTNRDLLVVVQAVNARLDAQSNRIDAQTAHYDTSLERVSACLENLRESVNDQMHAYEKRLHTVEESETERRVSWQIKTVLLRGSWRLTASFITLGSMITGVLVKWGFPWEWGLFGG